MVLSNQLIIKSIYVSRLVLFICIAIIIVCYFTEKYPQLMDLFHSLDIWHKAKKLTKALHQVCNNTVLSDVMQSCYVANHFCFLLFLSSALCMSDLT